MINNDSLQVKFAEILNSTEDSIILKKRKRNILKKKMEKIKQIFP